MVDNNIHDDIDTGGFCRDDRELITEVKGEEKPGNEKTNCR